MISTTSSPSASLRLPQDDSILARRPSCHCVILLSTSTPRRSHSDRYADMTFDTSPNFLTGLKFNVIKSSSLHKALSSHPQSVALMTYIGLTFENPGDKIAFPKSDPADKDN